MSMPSRKTQDGYKDICFPVTEEFRNELKQAVLGSVWRGTVHGTGIYLTDSTPSKSRAEHGLI